MLNHNPKGDPWEPGERLTLERLKLAIKYKQKAVIAHDTTRYLCIKVKTFMKKKKKYNSTSETATKNIFL